MSFKTIVMGRTISIVLMLLVMAVDVIGQPGFPPPPSQAIPLDIIVGLLLGAGVFYGLRRLVKTRQTV